MPQISCRPNISSPVSWLFHRILSFFSCLIPFHLTVWQQSVVCRLHNGRLLAAKWWIVGEVSLSELHVHHEIAICKLFYGSLLIVLHLFLNHFYSHFSIVFWPFLNYLTAISQSFNGHFSIILWPLMVVCQPTVWHKVIPFI